PPGGMGGRVLRSGQQVSRGDPGPFWSGDIGVSAFPASPHPTASRVGEYRSVAGIPNPDTASVAQRPGGGGPLPPDPVGQPGSDRSSPSHPTRSRRASGSKGRPAIRDPTSPAARTPAAGGPPLAAP